MSKIIKLAGMFLLLGTLAISYAGDLLTYFPKMSSETYLFALNDKLLNKLSWIAIPEQENELEKLKALFEQNGFKPAVIPEDMIARTLETGMSDCSVTTSKELVLELKDRFPKGLIISLFPKPTILKIGSSLD